VTINSTTETVNYNGTGAGTMWNFTTDPGTPLTLAQAVAAAFNNDPSSPVTAVASFINPDSIVVFTTKQTGSGTNYGFGAQLTSNTEIGQGLVLTPSGITLTGGH
jgi:phage tail sheath gpL-like